VAEWHEELAGYTREFPAEAAELDRRWNCRLAEGWDRGLKSYAVGDAVPTRKASSEAINALAGPVPELFGGAADLSESNMTDASTVVCSSRVTPAAATSASAFASTPWAASPTASPFTAASSHTRPLSSSSATTCVARCGWPP